VDDAAYLRAICEAPFDDGPRLVWADRLDELGECAWAEFVRVQVALAANPGLEHCTEASANWCPTCGDCRCPEPEESKCDEACPLHRPDSPHGEYAELRRRERELLGAGNAYRWSEPVLKILRGGYTRFPGDQLPPLDRQVEFRRGLVGSVTLTARQLFGGPCGRCNGFGFIGLMSSPFERTCSACSGTGRVEGLAAALFRAAPVTEVRLSDREPDSIGNGRLAWWYTDPDWHRPGLHQHHWLPVELRPHLTGRICEPVDEPRPGVCGFDYGDSFEGTDGVGLARADCSAACVAAGRARANLPALARPASADSPR
jgi:uncharacterized protein (TIGR02996 family)